jgi:CBS domain-containing protein
MSQLITELRPIDLSLAETKPALIAVSPTVSIQTALNLMSHNKITSLPMYSHKNTDIVSIINLLDILLYLVQGKEIEKEQLNLQDPVESVLGLDIDRESYRMHKVDRSDRLIEVSQGNCDVSFDL